ncbi:type IV secretion system protein [Jannaschia aquimarina]|uniref:Uncharacterized protein n=1 Tax=Jannaschia aquimarina TaxID=935700 RepID=A0A0D1CP79_9RHOB|nr:type IV secretion system protein [Jannaschia aquimarina]KIT16572.1 hypothetical protein jaqu_16670 [Jannaschia aquimarina]SNT41675.1 type IV secretion system protein VirB5 [Jannaschia aquimarina]
MQFPALKPCLFALMFAASALPASAQGVPTIDSANLLRQIQILEQLAADAGIQAEQLGQLAEQVRVLEEHLTRLEEIQALLSDPTEVLSLALGIDLDGLLEGEFDAEMLGTILRGARGDWSGITGGAAPDFEAAIDRALSGSGTSQEQITAMAESDDPAAQRNATATTSNAATSAAAEIAYEEAGQSVQRVGVLIGEIENLDTLKQSVDHNTRVTAELAVAMAALWQLESVQTMNVGLNGVLDAATLADIEQFVDFTQPEFD